MIDSVILVHAEIIDFSHYTSSSRRDVSWVELKNFF